MRAWTPTLRFVLFVLVPVACITLATTRGGSCADGMETLGRNHPDVLGYTWGEAVQHVAEHCCDKMSRPLHRLAMYGLHFRMGLSMEQIRIFAVTGHLAALAAAWAIARRLTRREWLATFFVAMAAASLPSTAAATYVATNSEVLRTLGILVAFLAAIHGRANAAAWLTIAGAYSFALFHKETSVVITPVLALAVVCCKPRRGVRAWLWIASICAALAAVTLVVLRSMPLLSPPSDGHYAMTPVVPNILTNLRFLLDRLDPLGGTLLVLSGIAAATLLVGRRAAVVRDEQAPQLLALVALLVISPLPYVLIRGGGFPPYYHLVVIVSWIAAAVLADRALDVVPEKRQLRRAASAVAVVTLTFAAGAHFDTYGRTGAQLNFCEGFRRHVDRITPSLAHLCQAESADRKAPIVMRMGGDAASLVGYYGFLIADVCGTTRPIYVGYLPTGGSYELETVSTASGEVWPEFVNAADVEVPGLAPRLTAAVTAERLASCPTSSVCISRDPVTGWRELLVQIPP